MSPMENALSSLALAAYAAAAFILFPPGSAGPRRAKVFLISASVGLFLHAAALGLRTWALGRVPLRITESLSLGLWIAAALALFFRFRGRGPASLPPAVFGFTALGMAYLIKVSPPMEPLIPVLRSAYLVIHVGLAVATLILVLLGAAASLSAFVSAAAGSHWEDWSDKLCVAAFLTWGGMILAGALWASQAWGRFWSWDPVESSSLATWFFFAAYLHLRRLHGWNGRKLAWATLILLAVVFLTVWVAPSWLLTLHNSVKY